MKLFDERPKLDEYHMRDRLKEMRDDDGTLLFCYDKRATTGMVLTVEQIKAWIGSEKQRRAKEEKKKKQQ